MALGESVVGVQPKKGMQGIKGHLWEQFYLPFKIGRGALVSPGNTGPLLVSRQLLIIHDASTFDCRDSFKGFFGVWYRWLLPVLAQRVRKLVTVSKYSRTRLALHLRVPEERIKVIYNGIEPPVCPPTPEAVADTRKRFGLDRPYFFFVGSLDPRKNLSRLVEAFLKAKLDGYDLAIAGGSIGHIFSGQLDTADKKNIRVLGRVSEEALDCLYAGALAFVFPSLYEGFGLPPLEAMARNCPVLCSDSTVMPEICGPAFEDGGACMYFHPESCDSIVGALKGFISAPPPCHQQMRERGMEHSKNFRWSSAATQIREALEEMK